ncbi:hypothetical protein [Sporofaciens sp. SGI.106]|uniref:hypothetical protein n=1 Tax=Sporofaciens sp. SGI.106 TaxID=3420568 RepID=UPI002A93E9FD|nr:hypothetical protein [Lachnoclostridium sp.]
MSENHTEEKLVENTIPEEVTNKDITPVEQTENETVSEETPAKTAVEETPDREDSAKKEDTVQYVKSCPFQDDFDLEDHAQTLSRDDYIIRRLRDEDLLEYLKMQERKEEKLRAEKELRNSRIFFLIQIAIIAVAVVLIVWFLKDNPTVLTNILYIGGILLAMWFWKHSSDKPDK